MFLFCLFLALHRRRETQFGAKREGKTTRGKTSTVTDSRTAYYCAATATSAGEFVKRDRRRHHSHPGRVCGKRDAEQCAGRRATSADAAQAQVLDGKLVHGGRTDRSRQPDIMSGGQLGRLRGKCPRVTYEISRESEACPGSGYGDVVMAIQIVLKYNYLYFEV